MTDIGGPGMTFDGFISYSHAADGRLAPAVQRGLHRLAKPWHRRRALWIFRDQTGLSVTPALWSSIQRALDGSEWFVLLASPEAARSPWVNREIEHWIATKPADRILPVVTDGSWQWDAERGDLTADSTAVPDALRGVFAEEPLYLDLRWARDDRQLSLQHSRFRDAIAQLAAPMHGVSKDELEGEDVLQHRRSWRLRWVAVTALALLTVMTSMTGVLAQHNADRATASAVEARRQQQVASQQRGNAERSAEQAQRQEQNARTQEENARTQQARARAASLETKRQEKRAREQQGVAERAADEAQRQLANASRQQELAKRAQSLAEQQRAVAQEQSKLAQQSAKQTARQTKIAEKQQRLAAEAAAETKRQKQVAQQQRLMAQEAAAEARRQESIARANEQKAKDAAAEARRQEKNATEQKQIAVGRRLINQAKATVGNDPTTALRLAIAAEKIQPSGEARSELTGLVASTRQLGTIGGVLVAEYGPGNILAVVSTDDFTGSLWNAANPAEPVLLAPLEGQWFVGKPAFSPDGKTLAMVGGDDFETMLYDVSDPAHPELIGKLPSLYSGFLTFSPDGHTLATATIDGLWALWDMTNRASPTLLTSRTDGYGAPITFSPDSHTVVTAGAPGTVWDITDRTEPAEVGTLEGDWHGVEFNPVRPLLATTDPDGNLAIWHMDDRTKPDKFSTTPARAFGATFSADGLTLVTGDNDGTGRLWDMAEDAPIHIADLNDYSGTAESTAFSADGRTVATAGSTGTLRLWTVEAHGAPTVVGRAVGSPQEGLSAALSSDGKRLTTAYFDGSATVWDMSKPTAPVERSTFRAHPTTFFLEGTAVSPNGDTMAAAAWEDPVTVWLTDLSNPSKPVRLGALPDAPYGGALAFSPDGRTLAARQEREIALWDLTNRREPTLISKIPLLDISVGAIAFSPDGKTFALATNHIITLWSLAHPSRPIEIGTLKGHSDDVIAMAFSPDGRTLVTGSEDKTAALWNVATKASLRRHTILTGNSAPVWSVAFAPDGRTVATGTQDDGAALWDVAELSNPVRIATLKRVDLRSKSLLFHPDGHTLVTSGVNPGNARALIWDYSALNALRANPAARACTIANGGFTSQEWTAYIPEAKYQPTCPR
jgi:WD40 repeat protein